MSLSSLWRVASISFSPRSFFINFSVLRSAKCHTNQEERTKSTLPDLLGRKSERRKQLYDYLHQSVRQGWRKRNHGINTEPAKEVLEGCKQINERVVASANVFDRLQALAVTRICSRDRRKDIQQVGWRYRRILLSQAGKAVTVEWRLEERNISERLDILDRYSRWRQKADRVY